MKYICYIFIMFNVNLIYEHCIICSILENWADWKTRKDAFFDKCQFFVEWHIELTGVAFVNILECSISTGEVILKYYLADNSFIKIEDSSNIICWHVAPKGVCFICLLWGVCEINDLLSWKVNIIAIQALRAIDSIDSNDQIFFVVGNLRVGHSFFILLLYRYFMCVYVCVSGLVHECVQVHA